jgi:hypothetical protein
MPMVYTWSLATAGNLTTNATPATETDAIFVKAGSSRQALITKIDAVGKAAALTAISSIAFRHAKLATASTAGTAITPSPTDKGMQAAVSTMASRPTIGATRTNRSVWGIGAGSGNTWWTRDNDSFEELDAGAANSFDVIDVSGTASLTYEISGELRE